MGHTLTGGWNSSSFCDGVSQSSGSDFPGLVASHKETGQCCKETPTRRLTAGRGSETTLLLSPQNTATKTFSSRYRKSTSRTRMVLGSRPISCSQSPPQEGGARKGRVPLLAFNPPERDGMQGQSPLLCHSTRAMQWAQSCSGSSERRKQRGKKKLVTWGRISVQHNPVASSG